MMVSYTLIKLIGIASLHTMSSNWDENKDILAMFTRVQYSYLDKCGQWGPSLYGVLIGMGS